MVWRRAISSQPKEPECHITKRSTGRQKRTAFGSLRCAPAPLSSALGTQVTQETVGIIDVMSEENAEGLAEAIEHFQKRAEKTVELDELLEVGKDFFKSTDRNDLAAIEARSRKYIEIAQARYESGNISEHELLFHKSFVIESQVHETRWLKGMYQPELSPISDKMREVERKYGLSDDEYWPISEAPEEYKELSKEYDDVLERKLLETFVEFGADDLKYLYLNDRKKFDELHHVGGKSVFLQSDRNKLQFMAILYEKEAEVASKGGAFFAASVMLGSAIEARLIVTCIDNDEKVRDALKRMGLTNKKLKSKNPLTWTLERLIEVCHEAGWIPDFDAGMFTYSGQAMLDFLRSTRNDVHPGVKIRKRNGLVMGGEQYKDVKHIHALLSSTLNWPNKQKQPDA